MDPDIGYISQNKETQSLCYSSVEIKEHKARSNRWLAGYAEETLFCQEDLSACLEALGSGDDESDDESDDEWGTP